MNIQRLRNLTTKRLHTTMSDIYEDIETLTGSKGIMTHNLPNAARALEPYLQQVAPAPRFWDGQHDESHVGDIEVPPMNAEQKAEFWKRFEALPHPFAR